MLPPEKPATPSPTTPERQLSPLHPPMIKRRLSTIHSAAPSPTSSSRRISGVVLLNGAPLQTIESGEAVGSGRWQTRWEAPAPHGGAQTALRVRRHRAQRLKFDSTAQIDEEGNDAQTPPVMGKETGAYSRASAEARTQPTTSLMMNLRTIISWTTTTWGSSWGADSSAVSESRLPNGGAERNRRRTVPMKSLKFAVKSVAHDGSKRSRQMVRDEVETMMAVSGRHPNLPIVFGFMRKRRAVTHTSRKPPGGKLLDGIGRRKRFTVGDWESVALSCSVPVRSCTAWGLGTGTSSRTTSC